MFWSDGYRALDALDIIALIKGETRRGWTMIGISVALIATIKMLSSYLGD